MPLLRLTLRSLLLSALCLSPAAAMNAQEGVQQFAHLGTCTLESGKTIQDCTVGYRTYGTLNADGSNAVLMPTWLYGTSGDLASLFGKQETATRLVDTSKFFGVALDALGNGVSSSPSNSKNQHDVAFPDFTIHDMVAVEYRVVTEVLHLKHAHAVLGLSMGGEQTFAWSVQYPNFFDFAVPIIGSPQLTVFDLQSKEIMLGAIFSDPDYQGGHYTKQPALKLANLYNVQAVTSPEYRNAVTPRADLQHFLEQSEAPVAMDANDRVWQLRAVMSQDVLRGNDLATVARATKAKWYILVNAKDRMVTPAPALQWAEAVHAPTYISQKPCGHLIMLCDAEGVSSRVTQFLASKP